MSSNLANFLYIFDFFEFGRFKKSLHLQLIISKFYNSAKFGTKNRKGAS